MRKLKGHTVHRVILDSGCLVTDTRSLHCVVLLYGGADRGPGHGYLLCF